MAECWISGRPAPLDDAIPAAASLLAASRAAVIAGLGTDIAGAEAAIALARRVGGAFDHQHAAAALRGLDVMREAGWIVVSMQQARALADLVLLVGPVPGELADGLGLGSPPPLAPGRPRRVLRLCPGDAAPMPRLGDGAVETIGSGAEELPGLLGVLRALVAGRRLGESGPRSAALSGAAEALRGARYGVAVWSVAELNALSMEMLCGMIDELNRRTRFAGLPLLPEDNVAGVIQAGCWQSGFPLRVGFGRGTPEHDPWRFDAARMVDSGEADAAVWISALSDEPPPWLARIPLVALVAEASRFPAPPDVRFTVGRPGRDHDAVLYDLRLGVLAAKPATAPRAIPTVADILARVSGGLEAPPC